MNENEDMIVLRPQNECGWIDAIIHGRWVTAKVLDSPSLAFGLNGGRISKLHISKNGDCNPNYNFHSQMAYAYDRGLDYDELCDDELLNNIIRKLEELPKRDV